MLPDDKVWQLDGAAARSDLTWMEEYRMYVAARLSHTTLLIFYSRPSVKFMSAKFHTYAVLSTNRKQNQNMYRYILEMKNILS